ncbi:MAG TPA: ABC transporter substrate-binding protein [Methylococcaceae bacterium]|nr:ABC transporter substrate-binding protein [Methylococcaceae bacterium]
MIALVRVFAPVLLLWSGLMAGQAWAEETVRVGSLAFGTLSWEMKVIQDAHLDRDNGIRLEVQTLAGPQAGNIALQADGVHVALSDWLWVSRQRENGRDFTYAPYSTSYGALLVSGDSGVRSIADLSGKRIGVAGGPLDKNWILLNALGEKQYGLNLQEQGKAVFGAPPLLNEQLKQGRLDAVLNHWHYAARLETAGYRRVLTGQELARQMGVTTDVPGMGYVFREKWAQQHPAALAGLLRASREAQRRLCEEDAAWNGISALMPDDDTASRAALRKGYCAGRVLRWGDEERRDADRLYGILRQAGGVEEFGKAEHIAPGTFWSGAVVP